jgi:hypothetical protein
MGREFREAGKGGRTAGGNNLGEDGRRAMDDFNFLNSCFRQRRS